MPDDGGAIEYVVGGMENDWFMPLAWRLNMPCMPPSCIDAGLVSTYVLKSQLGTRLTGALIACDI